MSPEALLRFGPVGTALLAALPLSLAGRYVFAGALARYAGDSRSANDAELGPLWDRFEDAGVPVADVVVTPGVGTAAGLGGPPWRRTFVVSEGLLRTASATELAGLAGIAAGQHEERYPELYAACLVAASGAFAVFVGVDPSGFRSATAAVALLAGLGASVVGCFALLRRRTYAVDETAADRVGRDAVRAAIDAADAGRGPDWVPDAVRPKPSAERRLERL